MRIIVRAIAVYSWAGCWTAGEWAYQIQGLLSLRSDSPKIVAAKRFSEWMTTPPTICLLTSYNLVDSFDDSQGERLVVCHVMVILYVCPSFFHCIPSSLCLNTKKQNKTKNKVETADWLLRGQSEESLHTLHAPRPLPLQLEPLYLIRLSIALLSYYSLPDKKAVKKTYQTLSGRIGLSLLRLKMRVEKAMVARRSWTKMAKELISSQVPPACGGAVVLPSSSGRALDDRVKKTILYAWWWWLSLWV